MLRIAFAFLAAPLVGLVGGALTAGLLSELGDLGGLGYAWLLVLGGAFFAYPSVLIVGVPLFLVLRRFRLLSLWAFLAIGALFGLIGWIVASSPIPSSEFYFRAMIEGIFGLVSGLVGAAAFWRITVHDNKALTSMSSERA